MRNLYVNVSRVVYLSRKSDRILSIHYQKLFLLDIDYLII